VEEQKLESAVCPSFGRAPLYVLYDTESGACDFLDNSAAASQGGAGIRAAQNILDQGAGAVITYRCGENAAQVLEAAGITLCKAQDGTVRDNIEKYKAGALAKLNEIHPGLHNHG
jgi:predicted Fe-Mo cluster-binding NifX family protein